MIRYQDNLEKLESYAIDGFCVGWKKPLSDNNLKAVIANSTFILLAIEDETNRIIGIITALSDKTNWAFIPYLEVVPEYQKQGIGKELMGRMLDKLGNINCIDLTCDPEMQPFYEQFGMLKSEGMVIRKYLHQSGDDE
jgi:predicted N-acetyltransferase YhbS